MRMTHGNADYEGQTARSVLKTDTELLDWIARNYRVLLAYPGDVRLMRLERSEKSDANSIARFRAAPSKVHGELRAVNPAPQAAEKIMRPFGQKILSTSKLSATRQNFTMLRVIPINCTI
jgi:hypothetical protein